ncbi:Hypothetical protein NCS54_01486700 [Fusarium falciforme]|uniref:Hypothetical protein n=1 Tax=Fusarium falciforme TaxID=195108 RepID=UPI002300DA8F|nr:Hypothetical protein NCS54_01486700 [Fusarium falciforme]WAO97153.1 Hypothetical protein NCS54_01486700 [Fusarium falciforme]
MIESSSTFIASSIPLLHNAVKSMVFKFAELLMALFIYKLFSLLASRSNQFTSYLMFAEDYMQRWLFLSSSGISRAGFIVLLFSILSALASLYGTLLWALDSPGYIFRVFNVTVPQYESLRNRDSPYIIQLYLDPSTLQGTEETLAQAVGSELFKPGLNYTLTGEVQRGSPETTTPTRHYDVGARIWLDDDGFSVSPDSYAMIPESAVADGQKFPANCIYFGGGSALWNCTFNNTFSQSIMESIIGRPEVHWDDDSDLKLDSRYVTPNRADNIWFSFGRGGGSAAMMQVFTVTKGTRRHTFVEHVSRVTMLTNPGVPFAAHDIGDLVRRTWTINETDRNNLLIDQVVEDIMGAQDQNLSYHFGVNAADNGNLTVLQSSWGYLTVSLSSTGEDLFSLISFASVNITLIRSETIDKPPTPFGKCARGSFQNEAFGGRITQTDCVGSTADNNSNMFFGQVDTAAVLIIHGLGNGRSNVSSESLNDSVMSWTRNMSATMEGLLVARGYIVSVDPALVMISVDKLTVAISGLQLLLSILALVLAGAAWLALAFFADSHWSNTFLANLVYATSEKDGKKSRPGYMHDPPSVEMIADGDEHFISVSGKAVALRDRILVHMNSLNEELQEEGRQKQGFGRDVYSSPHNGRDQAEVT